MTKPKRMRNLVGILKDKVSLIKATLLLSATRSASLHVAVLRATSHNPLDPPPDHTLDDVLALTNHHRPTATALVHALLQRVHQTSNAYVALKCLLTFHHLILRGSRVVNDQIIGVGPLFDLSTFRDQSGDDTWEISNWIRWYAALLDYKISLPFKKSLNLLSNFLEKISLSPDTLHYQKISLVYEVMKIMGDEYRTIIRDIYAKMEEFSTRIEDFDDSSLDNFLDDLKRIEKCKEKLLLMFLNKKKNDGFWELIDKVKKDVEEERRRRESLRMVKFTGNELRKGRVDESRLIVVAPIPRVRRWLDVEWNTLIVPTTA